MQVRDRDLVLLGILGNFGDGFSLTRSRKASPRPGSTRVEPVASLLEIERGERR
jgi:hypothetical protein